MEYEIIAQNTSSRSSSTGSQFTVTSKSSSTSSGQVLGTSTTSTGNFFTDIQNSINSSGLAPWLLGCCVLLVFLLIAAAIAYLSRKNTEGEGSAKKVETSTKSTSKVSSDKA